MTSNQVFAELVQRIGAGGNVRDDFPFTLGDVMPHLDYSFSYAVKSRMNEIYASTRTHGIDSSITKRYTIPVSDNVGQLPVSIVRLPNDLGVYQVQYKGNVFKKTTPDYVDKFLGLAALHVVDQPRYWVEDDQIKFFGLGHKDCDVTALLIPLPSSLEPDDEILFPAGYETMIIDTVLQRMGFGFQIPQDPANDGKK